MALQTDKRRVGFSDDEIEIMLRAWNSEPGDYGYVLTSLKLNSARLPETTQELYREGNTDRLRKRCRDKIQALIKNPSKIPMHLRYLVDDIQPNPLRAKSSAPPKRPILVDLSPPAPKTMLLDIAIDSDEDEPSRKVPRLTTDSIQITASSSVSSRYEVGYPISLQEPSTSGNRAMLLNVNHNLDEGILQDNAGILNKIPAASALVTPMKTTCSLPASSTISSATSLDEPPTLADNIDMLPNVSLDSGDEKVVVDDPEIIRNISAAISHSESTQAVRSTSDQSNLSSPTFLQEPTSVEKRAMLPNVIVGAQQGSKEILVKQPKLMDRTNTHATETNKVGSGKQRKEISQVEVNENVPKIQKKKNVKKENDQMMHQFLSFMVPRLNKVLGDSSDSE